MTETMVVLVILGVLSAVALPYWGKDRSKDRGVTFAQTIARDMQRARVQAVSERLPVRVYVFSDRVEFRSATPGATPMAPPVPPNAAAPAQRRIEADPDVRIFDVRQLDTPPAAQTIDAATPVVIEFQATGTARIIGAGPLVPAFIYVRHNKLPAGDARRQFRVDVTPLTGFVALREAW